MAQDIDIATFTKNNNFDIKVRLINEHGRTYVDIRQWKVVRDKCFPTYSGVRFDTAYFDGLREAVDAIAQLLESIKKTSSAES